MWRVQAILRYVGGTRARVKIQHLDQPSEQVPNQLEQQCLAFYLAETIALAPKQQKFVY